MKQLDNKALSLSSGGYNPFEMMAPYTTHFDLENVSPDIRFTSQKAYKKPFDPVKCLKALSRGQSYSYDLISDNGQYAVEFAISFGNTPFKEKYDLHLHTAISVVA